MNGKGSRRRPQAISQEEMARRWQAAFSRSRSAFWDDYKEQSGGRFRRDEEVIK